MRFLTSGFFHESIVPGPWIHMLKYFRKYFRFRGDIHEISFFSYQFPGHDTRKSIDFRVLLPGNQLISREHYPEMFQYF